MSEDIPRLPVRIDFATGRALYPNGDEISRETPPLAVPAGSTIIISVEFFDRELTAGLDWKLTPHPLPAENTYLLRGGAKGAADVFGEVPGEFAEGRLTFEVSTHGSLFHGLANDIADRYKCTFSIVEQKEDGIKVERAKVPFLPCPAGGVLPGTGDSSSGKPSYSGMTLNGLSGAVKLLDSNGALFSTSDNGIIIPDGGDNGISYVNPPTEMPKTSPYGPAWELDAVTPDMKIGESLQDLKKVRFKLVSADSAVTGNIVIIPAVNEVKCDAVTLAVKATTAWVEFELIASGMLTFTRDTEAAGDTLKSEGEAVGALILMADYWMERPQ